MTLPASPPCLSTDVTIQVPVTQIPVSVPQITGASELVSANGTGCLLSVSGFASPVFNVTLAGPVTFSNAFNLVNASMAEETAAIGLGNSPIPAWTVSTTECYPTEQVSDTKCAYLSMTSSFTGAWTATHRLGDSKTYLGTVPTPWTPDVGSVPCPPRLTPPENPNLVVTITPPAPFSPDQPMLIDVSNASTTVAIDTVRIVFLDKQGVRRMAWDISSPMKLAKL